jgi:hypothetical protein
MNTSAKSTDVFAILAVAQANWPHDPVAGSEAVWRKWSEQLGRYCFEEVATALDTLVRTHPRVPSLAELLGELGARRGASTTRIPSASLTSHVGHHRWPPVPLAADYVIGPYSLAFAEMNTEGWTTDRLMECIRAALQSPAEAAWTAGTAAGVMAAAPPAQAAHGAPAAPGK